MANNFIANNSPQKTLSGRLNNIIKFSTELRWLVGFFYFSGWQEIYESLKSNDDATIKLLVGLQVGTHLSKIFEHDIQSMDLSSDDYFNDFMTSLGLAINNEDQDSKRFYDQVEFFVHMIVEERLVIRKTKDPNHAKLYLFEMNEEEYNKHCLKGYLITGSSNLTRSGLRSQQEFNVEIKDYGYDEAVKYFEDLWSSSVPITEIENRRNRVVEFIQHRSHAAHVTPFEAYTLILKTFLDNQNIKKLKPQVENLLEDNGFKKFSYQIDAVEQALAVIEENNGVVIADVVGLGKSVIASLIARNLDTKGLIICPPGLMGNPLYETGWWGYVKKFDLMGWEVVSRGAIENLAETLHERDKDKYEVVIIDEAHNFRNQDTSAYEALAQICRGKKVILLTATPFNNSPADIFAMLKLFIVPGLSSITLEDNLEGLFRHFNYRFKQLSFILKNYNSSDNLKRSRAEGLYTNYLGVELPVDAQIVRDQTQMLANTIKDIISPVVIRRNRIDLRLNSRYAKEVGELSVVKPPIEMFYYLTESQSKFYDRIVSEYFSENGIFSGAIYQPSQYEKTIEEDSLNEIDNRRYQQQRNLYDFMRRLLVKRFESSFGAFEKSIERFINVHEVVLQFIENSNGKYILDRDLMEKIYEFDSEEIDEILQRFENELLKRKTPKNTTVYSIDDFQSKEKFLSDINKDLELFKRIKKEISDEDLVINDPKRDVIYTKIEDILKAEPNRKIILFTEYTDTVRHLQPYFRKKLGNKVLICDGNVTRTLAKDLEQNFNAQYAGTQHDNFQVLITSDKLSEGFNLNRAGVVINYDIPWNPTRVIQRVGRINRIGTKVFDSLYIYNFFPSEIGSSFVKSREIAEQKMFMIHNSLGEDSQIFNPKETPTASGLYSNLNKSPEEDEEAGLFTRVNNLYEEICEKHPEVIVKISKLPNRVKTAKKSSENNINVLRRKGLALFAQQLSEVEGSKVDYLSFENLLTFVESDINDKRLPLSKKFWEMYEEVKRYKENIRTNQSDVAIERKAHNNLKVALKVIDVSEEENIEFIKTLIKDIKEYYTMPKYSLRRLASEELTPKSSNNKWKQFWEELDFIKKRYGVDYLERVLDRVKDMKEEVIIAVENRL